MSFACRAKNNGSYIRLFGRRMSTGACIEITEDEERELRRLILNGLDVEILPLIDRATLVKPVARVKVQTEKRRAQIPKVILESAPE